MFDIISGLNEGSQSVLLVQRNTAPNVPNLEKGTAVMVRGGVLVPADSADATFVGSEVEFVWDDTIAQGYGRMKGEVAPGGYTCASGSMEAVSTVVTPTADLKADALLTVQAGKLVAQATPDIAKAVGRVMGIQKDVMDFVTGKSEAVIVRFKKL